MSNYCVVKRVYATRQVVVLLVQYSTERILTKRENINLFQS